MLVGENAHSQGSNLENSDDLSRSKRGGWAPWGTARFYESCFMWVRHQGLHSFHRRSKSFWRGIYLPCFTWPCSFLFFTRFSLRRRLCWRWWCIDGWRRSERRWQWTLDERWRGWRISCSIHECHWYGASFSRLDAALSDDQQGKLNQQRFNEFLSSSKDGKFLTTDDGAAARMHFTADSKANNPQVLWSEGIEKRAWGNRRFFCTSWANTAPSILKMLRYFSEKKPFHLIGRSILHLVFSNSFRPSKHCKMRQVNMKHNRKFSTRALEAIFLFWTETN